MERSDSHPGDLVEVVGYPNLSRNELVLQGVLVRRTGSAALPPAQQADESGLPKGNLNSIRVRVTGKLLGWHLEERPRFGNAIRPRLYLARIASGAAAPRSWSLGSRLALAGVYVGRAITKTPKVIVNPLNYC